jgi:DNA-binding winged helix-turn-helix (wHTH) protein/tetratricopeptide (TPR) repeat protein
MNDISNFVFGPFRFDATHNRLWRGQEEVDLRAKPLVVLRYLLEHSGQVITRADFLKQVWAGIYVTTTALRVCVREIRLALGDDATAPQYIETVGRQGYRFIALVSTAAPPVVSGQWSVVSSDKERTKPPQLRTENRPLVTHFVGREREMARLHQWFTGVLAGHRQVVFVTGEAGIGKTTLVNTFLHHVQEASPVWIAHGQCIEQYGVGAPYLPLFGALGQLCQAPDAEHLVRVFEQHAPVWLAQLPTLLSQAQRHVLSPILTGIPHERMLRELADVLAILSIERPIVLVVEDLHWSDAATINTLAYLVQRRESARLLILGTYRPADIVIGEHPLRRLRQELLAHELCQELRVELLSEADVEAYVTQRLAGNPLAAELSPRIYQRTEGNALFVVNVVDYLLRRGLVQKTGNQAPTLAEVVAAIETELPAGLRHLILEEVEGLRPEEQDVLEAASVAGPTFTAAEVAAVEKREEKRVEAVCEGLVRQQRLIEARGIEEWPDGTLTAGYQFRHAVYQQVVGTCVGPARQVRWHRLIGERLETGYGARAAEIANHLAVHFEQGRDNKRAVHYRRQAAEHALRQNAYQEVYLHSTAGLALLETLPDSLERKHLELGLRQLVSATLYTTRGFMDAELEANLQRARHLCRELEDETTLVSILIGLGRLLMMRANSAAMAELEQEEERLAERISDAQLLVQLHTQLATVATFRGLHARAAEHYHHVLEYYDPQSSPLLLSSFGGDLLAAASAWSGVSLSLAGQPEQGWSRIAQALTRAETLNQPLVLVNGLLCATIVKLLRGEYDEAWRLAQKMDALASEYHFSVYKIAGVLLQGGMTVYRGAWEEGLAALTTGLSQYLALGAQQLIPFFLSFLVEGYRQQGKLDAALQAVHEALSVTATNFDVFWEAELYRLKGELTLQSQASPKQVKASQGKSRQVHSPRSRVTNPQPPIPNPKEEAEACFRKAIEVARDQGAKLLELRAVISLARLWHQQDKTTEAYTLLAELYGWFTEGFDTADLQAARTLLAEWAASSQRAG